MEPNQEDTNEPLKGQPANQFETADSNVEIESPPPQDKNDVLYVVLIAIGIGFALPFYRYYCLCFSYLMHISFHFNEFTLKCNKILISVIS